jgi:hypothetical protein
MRTKDFDFEDGDLEFGNTIINATIVIATPRKV